MRARMKQGTMSWYTRKKGPILLANKRKGGGYKWWA